MNEIKDIMDMTSAEIIDELKEYGKQLGNKPSSSLLCNTDGSLSAVGVRAIKLQHLLTAHFEMELKDILQKYNVLAPYLQGEVWSRFTGHIRSHHQAYMEDAMTRETQKPSGNEIL